MNAPSDLPQISTVTDLLAVAHQIEIDAIERYTLLAQQMETHNNADLAAVFRDLVRAERLHAEEIRRLGGGADLAAHAARVAVWRKTESPEAVDMGAAHYLMTSHDALQLALAGEERALAYYREVAHGATDPAVRDLARRFAEEEAEHVELCHHLLRKNPPPLRRPDDPDPAISQE